MNGERRGNASIRQTENISTDMSNTSSGGYDNQQAVKAGSLQQRMQGGGDITRKTLQGYGHRRTRLRRGSVVFSRWYENTPPLSTGRPLDFP